jgi:hypothetical protein
MFPRLLEIAAGAGTIERHLALLTAALRADAPMNCRAKALFFSLFTDRTTHKTSAPEFIITRKIDFLWSAGRSARIRRKAAENDCPRTASVKKRDFCGLLRFLNEKNRIKCGSNAIFPQERDIRWLPSQENQRST